MTQSFSPDVTKTPRTIPFINQTDSPDATPELRGSLEEAGCACSALYITTIKKLQ